MLPPGSVPGLDLLEAHFLASMNALPLPRPRRK
jgi:hypothetical protein